MKLAISFVFISKPIRQLQKSSKRHTSHYCSMT